ncbi:MAG: heme exporter protein CcmD [Betaproteobacteria bacterium]
MYWNSFSEFLAMGNHGVYVWGSVAVMTITMILEPLLLIRGQKSLIARLKRQLRADKSYQSSDHNSDRTSPSQG